MSLAVLNPVRLRGDKLGAGSPRKKDREMRSTAWWLQDGILICGNEGEGDAGSGGDSGAGGAAGGDAGGSSSGDAGSGSGGDADDDKGGDASGDGQEPEDLKGLKSALAAERAINKGLKNDTKELKRLQKLVEEAELKDKTELEKATAAQKKADEKAAKLAVRLRDQAVDAAIERAARKLKFRDPDIALQLVSRADLGVEQDEDDPSDITVDQKKVDAAVKKLADDKKYLVGEEGDGDPTGSKFGSGSGKSKKELTAEALKAKYPSL
jgi:hypothetical protein